MAYVKQTWVDHIVADDTGEVLQYGTIVNAERMNHIETGIADAYTEVHDIVGDMPERVTIKELHDDVNKLKTESNKIEPIKKTVDAHELRINKLEETSNPGAIEEKLANKVDKVPGKQLSTNDYTTEEKTKLAGIPANTKESIDALQTGLGEKVDKEQGKVLSSNDFTTPLKNKLDKIPENTADLIKSLQTEMSPLKVLNVKLNHTIPTEAYQNVVEATLKKKFYADVPCTKSKVSMNCQISPADSVEDVSLLTYAEPLEGKVRCYFMDKPVAPYVIESIEFTNVIQSEELQAQSVYEQEMAEYLVWKEQHDKEVAEAQKAIAEAKAKEEAQKEQRLATMESNIRNVEQASAGMAEAVNDMKPKVTFMATKEVENIVSDYTSGQGNMPTDIMDIADTEPWQVGKAYKKGDLIVYESKTGFVKQDHTSQANWIPFTTGTEALYGARPKAINGVYPYVYNMALEVGMIVEHNGVKYRAIQNANELLFEPSQVPALLTPIKEGE